MAEKPMTQARLTDRRIMSLLKRVEKEGGQCSANDDKYAPIMKWCDDRGNGTDTFNLANDLGYLCTTTDSDSDNSVTYLTVAGRDALKQGA